MADAKADDKAKKQVKYDTILANESERKLCDWWNNEKLSDF